MIKTNKFWCYLVVSFFCLSLTGGSALSAATPAKQLAKGISLYNDGKDQDAMDYFIDVMVNGNPDEVAQANKYMELIHNRLGGIQTPVEVDVNFKEGELRNLEETADASILAAQEQAQAAAEEAAAKAQAAKEAAEAAAAAKRDEALAAVEAEQRALTDRIEAQRMAAMDNAEMQRQAALQKASDLNDELLGAAAVGATVEEAGLDETAEADDKALSEEEEEEWSAAQNAQDFDNLAEPDQVLTNVSGQPVSSTFADLTTPEALEARDLYTSQKIASMTSAAMEKINAVKGVHLYMRDGKPDALDIDPEVLFDRNKFRTEALPLLNNVYELLALTQGAAYVILPPGSYTDDVTLSGIRQAMALNSYLISRGISQGKLHYNMGLADQEPPAQFANLNGVAVVFDYDAKLPANLEKNENNVKAPLLSMAVVPLCHAIDRSLGEAYAIDFSVLETVNPVDNWMLQIVQHGRDGNFYVVRQLEGFTPVYHQILWNGRKGIIGPELPCGKYTLALTATDLKGEKQTLRRRVVVKCSDQKTGSCQTGSCQTKASDDLCPSCDYKTARLWVKPGRTMRSVSAPAKTKAAPLAETTNMTTTTTTVTNTVNIVDADTPDTLSDSLTQDIAPLPQAPAGDYQTPQELPVNNPYDMPYEEYGN